MAVCCCWCLHIKDLSLIFLLYMYDYIRMQRNKGQFTSAKKSEGGYGWDGVQDSGLDDSQQETS